MNPQITPEIRIALEQQPVGPVRLNGEATGGPACLVQLDDIATQQEFVNGRVPRALAEADQDIAFGRIVDGCLDEKKHRGGER